MQRPEDTADAIERIEQRIEAIAVHHAARTRELELELSDELAAVRQSLLELAKVLRR
jgi:hypothetical protein